MAGKVSPHPGQVKAELNSIERGDAESDKRTDLERRIHQMLFADVVEEREAADVQG